MNKLTSEQVTQLDGLLAVPRYDHDRRAIKKNLHWSLKVLAADCVEQGRYDEAVELLHPVLKKSPGDYNAQYRLGCAYAGLRRKAEMLDALGKASKSSKAATGDDYRQIIAANPVFASYAADPDFRSLVSSLPDDPQLSAIYQALRGTRYDEVLDLGEQALLTAHDRLAVLHAMRDATRTVVGDLDEHGAENAGLYEHPRGHYQALLVRLNSDIALLEAAGATSTLYKTFRG